MGLNIPHAVGHNFLFFNTLEATAGIFTPPTGADAARVLSADFDWKEPAEPREDWQTGRAPYETIPMRGEYLFNVESYIIPHTAAGSLPDLHPLLASSMATFSQGATVIYSLASTQPTRACSLTRVGNAANLFYREDMYGCIVDEWKTTCTGGEPPKWTFSGEGMGLIHTGYGTVQSSTATTLTLGTGEGAGYMAGSRVTVQGQDNGGVGFSIDSVAGDVLTDAAAGGWGGEGQLNDIVRPFAPTPTTVGSPISSLLGTVTLDGTDIQPVITGFECSVKQNYDKVKDNLFASGMTDAIGGKYSIDVKLTIRARRDFIVEMGRRRLFGARNLQVRIGSTTGRNFLYALPQLRLQPGKINLPSGGGSGTMELVGFALDSADGANNALTVTHA